MKKRHKTKLFVEHQDGVEKDARSQWPVWDIWTVSPCLICLWPPPSVGVLLSSKIILGLFFSPFFSLSIHKHCHAVFCFFFTRSQSLPEHTGQYHRELLHPSHRPKMGKETRNIPIHYFWEYHENKMVINSSFSVDNLTKTPLDAIKGCSVLYRKKLCQLSGFKAKLFH